jgi:hypothetical protein
MLKYLLLSLIVISSAGCSITPDYYDYQAPYCYTDETTKIVDGQTVDSEVQLECTDRPGKQMEIARAGIDTSCEEFWYNETRWGKLTKVRGVRCEKLDGSWEILNIYGTVR